MMRGWAHPAVSIRSLPDPHPPTVAFREIPQRFGALRLPTNLLLVFSDGAWPSSFYLIPARPEAARLLRDKARSTSRCSRLRGNTLSSKIWPALRNGHSLSSTPP